MPILNLEWNLENARPWFVLLLERLARGTENGISPPLPEQPPEEPQQP